ncbi:MAG: PSD1 and planctomycete cytochrome C domain-containing protein [Bryobacteraceae bacterium]
MRTTARMLGLAALLFGSVATVLPQPPDFERQVLPIFKASCAPCHVNAQPQAHLRLDTLAGVMQGGSSGPAIVPGKSGSSMLYQRITSTDSKLRMPPAGAPLGAGQVALIAQWIDSRPPGTASGKVDFVTSVEPILRASCQGCHSGPQPKSDLRLDSKSAALRGGAGGPVIVPGASDRSRLIQRVEGHGKEARMPLNGNPLTTQQIATLKLWIDEGAEWPETAAAQKPVRPKHWAYVKPVKPVPPEVHHPVRNPIDNFLLARLEQDGLSFSAEASKEKLARRLYLDLIGIPPSPAELDAYLNDHSPDAYEKLVEKLLASPHYGERWARPWLDLARYADSNGYEKDDRRSIWKYRDWVINALNKDMPYDEFTIEQIAGDMLPNSTEDQKVATGFQRNTQFNEEGGVDKDESYFEVQVDRVATTGTVWLGSTLACTQCHNHKFDPFTQRDFYSMMAFFNNVDKRTEENGETPIYIEPTLEMPTAEQKTHREALEARIKALEEKTETFTPALKAEQATWEKSVLQAEGTWRVLTPSEMSAAAGTTLAADTEGRIFASGEKPRNEAYVIEGALPVKSTRALRLEALPNPQLPRGGPGRDAYGNFNITQIKVEVPDGAEWKAVTVKKLVSDTGSRSTDPKRGSMWNVDASREDERLTRQLVLVLSEPLRAQKVRVTLVQESEFSCQSVGYFRFSATDSADPEAVVNVSHALRPLLGKSGRTEEQEKKLGEYFLTVAASLKETRDQLKQANAEKKKLDIVSTLVMRERQTFDRPYDFIRTRGGFSAKAEKVYANVPAILPPLPDDVMPNRLGLARWLVSKDNPLTARVEVNRIWEQFFGHGIVETSEDFGTQGQRPSHPELLDWLATEFMDRGWSMKTIDRLIVTSAAYRQDSHVTPDLLARDQYNRLLAHGPRFRMEAEMVRDTVLAASGLLSAKIGGPSVFPPQPAGIWDMPYNDDVYVESQGEDRYRRGIYTFMRRSAPYPAMINFDAPSREICTVRRTRTNTPLQALDLLNDKGFWEAARAMADRLAKEGGADAASRIDYGYRLATSRHAKPDEIDYLVKYKNEETQRFSAHPDEAKRIGGDVETAAWTMVANVLLNLDETITKE